MTKKASRSPKDFATLDDLDSAQRSDPYQFDPRARLTAPGPPAQAVALDSGRPRLAEPAGKIDRPSEGGCLGAVDPTGTSGLAGTDDMARRFAFV